MKRWPAWFWPLAGVLALLWLARRVRQLSASVDKADVDGTAQLAAASAALDVDAAKVADAIRKYSIWHN